MSFKNTNITTTQTETKVNLVLKKKRPNVTWDDSVIDNEFMNKKKSKS